MSRFLWGHCLDVFVHDLITGETILVSKSSLGEQGNRPSSAGPLSGDGRYIAFNSWSTNLVPGDNNNFCDYNGDLIANENCRDGFIHDLLTGITDRVTVSSSGTEANYESRIASISDDGRYVVLTSAADNLVEGDTNNFCDWDIWDNIWSGDNCSDIFLHDRQIGETVRISVSTNGTQANGESFAFPHSISDDGRFIVFSSDADNLDRSDYDNWCDRDFDFKYDEPCFDVFLHDRLTGETKLISKSISTSPVYKSDSLGASISGDGRYVAYWSGDLIVPGDVNGSRDIFVYDRINGITEIASVSSTELIGNGDSYLPSLSENGRYISFISEADNLVKEDSNDLRDLFIRDRQTGKTELVSVSTSGVQINSIINTHDISGDGRFLVFDSYSVNLVEDDVNEKCDIFLRDRGLEPMDYPPAAYLPIVLVKP